MGKTVCRPSGESTRSKKKGAKRVSENARFSRENIHAVKCKEKLTHWKRKKPERGVERGKKRGWGERRWKVGQAQKKVAGKAFDQRFGRLRVEHIDKKGARKKMAEGGKKRRDLKDVGKGRKKFHRGCNLKGKRKKRIILKEK